jgi:FkbM family methyltransferase
MIKNVVRNLGLMPYAILLQEKYFPKKHQIESKNLFPKRAAFYAQFLKKGDICFDVGANLGNRSEVFLHLGAKVIAVEPQKDCIKYLSIKYGNKLTIEKYGLGPIEEERTMYINDESIISSFDKEWVDEVQVGRFKRFKFSQTAEIKMTTLDKLIEKHGRPSFCKIDVEGFELQVLKGLTQPLPCISIEYMAPEFKQKSIDCLNYLYQLDNQILINYSVGESMEWENEEWLNYQSFLELMQTETFDKTIFGDIYIKSNC